MSDMIAWIAAEAGRASCQENTAWLRRHNRDETPTDDPPAQQGPNRKHGGETEESRNFPPRQKEGKAGQAAAVERWRAEQDANEEDRRRRIYRGRTVAMLRRYMRYSIETGRLPSLLGREFFRSKFTSYTVVTFEDRVIFVHDMERCLGRLDEFSRELIARHILQEHDQAETSRLLQCAERTVRAYVPMALDLLSDILLEVGLLEGFVPNREESCQGGLEGHFSVSHCEDGRNKF